MDRATGAFLTQWEIHADWLECVRYHFLNQPDWLLKWWYPSERMKYFTRAAVLGYSAGFINWLTNHWPGKKSPQCLLVKEKLLVHSHRWYRDLLCILILKQVSLRLASLCQFFSIWSFQWHYTNTYWYKCIVVIRSGSASSWNSA